MSSLEEVAVNLMWHSSSVTSVLEYLFVSKRYPTADTTVLLAKNYFKIAQKVAKSLDSFCNKICSQDLPKIAQSGRTVHQSKWKCFRFFVHFRGIFFLLFQTGDRSVWPKANSCQRGNYFFPKEREKISKGGATNTDTLWAGALV